MSDSLRDRIQKFILENYLFTSDASALGPDDSLLARGIVAEHDGEIERDLKQRWVQMFRVAPSIRRAFLVKATRPGETTLQVLLVIASRGEPEAALAESIERMAAAELPAEPDFELLWLRPGECAPIERVCSAFYYAA